MTGARAGQTQLCRQDRLPSLGRLRLQSQMLGLHQQRQMLYRCRLSREHACLQSRPASYVVRPFRPNCTVALVMSSTDEHSTAPFLQSLLGGRKQPQTQQLLARDFQPPRRATPELSQHGFYHGDSPHKTAPFRTHRWKYHQGSLYS